MREYNREQWQSFAAVKAALDKMQDGEIAALRSAVEPYIAFRRELRGFHERFFAPHCMARCFETAQSACCGFESIFTFFSDQAITYLLSGPEERDRIFQALLRPFRSDRCVYLGPKGCVWVLPPISCAFFYCDAVKEHVFAADPEAASIWRHLREAEKAFTYPDRPVLFDTVEALFRAHGVDSPHMYFHKSPGLLRIKREAGLVADRPRRGPLSAEETIGS